MSGWQEERKRYHHGHHSEFDGHWEAKPESALLAGLVGNVQSVGSTSRLFIASAYVLI